MSPFDSNDLERWPPSAATNRCRLCAEAALSRNSGYCFRHFSTPINASAARAAIRSAGL
jgi:hypothetical protein